MHPGLPHPLLKVEGVRIVVISIPNIAKEGKCKKKEKKDERRTRKKRMQDRKEEVRVRYVV